MLLQPSAAHSTSAPSQLLRAAKADSTDLIRSEANDRAATHERRIYCCSDVQVMKDFKCIGVDTDIGSRTALIARNPRSRRLP